MLWRISFHSNFNFQREKYLILKKKYHNAMGQLSQGVLASPVLLSPSSESVSSMTPTSVNPFSYFSASEESLDVMSPSRHPPPYRSPPPPASSPIHPGPQTTSLESATMGQEGELEREKDTYVEVRSPSTDDSLNSSAGVVEETVIYAPPPVPPRRKSNDRIKLENKENAADTTYKRPKITGSDTGNKMVSKYILQCCASFLNISNKWKTLWCMVLLKC